MKAVTTSGWGLKAQLIVAEFAEPGRLGPDDVLIQVHAASVNPKDWKLNYHAAAFTPPSIRRIARPLFGDDLSGIVVDKGSKVVDFDIGDAVYGMDMRPRTASLAELTKINQQRIAKKPPSLSFCDAAVMPLAALTALQGLRIGHASKGCSVLIIGASGGVGCFAIQIAKAHGCRVVAVCSGRNAELVRQLGADDVIDYTAGDYRNGSGQFDLVFDVTSYETPASCAPLLAPSGYFVSTGGHAKSVIGTQWHRLRGKNAAAVVVESWRSDLQQLTELVESGELRPIIDSTFELANSEQAYQRSRSGRARGKIAIEIVSSDSRE